MMRKERGSAMLEFTLVGILLLFVLISTFEIARGMWTYHTLAYAAREGTRYASMHGKGCASPNTCQITVGQIASLIESAGPGMDPNNTTLTLTPASGSATSDTIANLLSNSTTWPPAAASAPGKNVQISLNYPFQTFLAILWQPGAGSQVFHLAASSEEPIQY
jgi:Flp pilus assembly protein TadG